MKTTWILVANASQGLVLETTRSQKQRPWAVVSTHQHPESRAKGVDLKSDGPGSKPSSSPGAQRSTAEPQTWPKEVESERFAGELGEVVRHALNENRYEQLVIVAPPHFLGLLRKEIGTQVEKHVIHSIDKDYTHLDVAALQDKLMDLV